MCIAEAKVVKKSNEKFNVPIGYMSYFFSGIPLFCGNTICMTS